MKRWRRILEQVAQLKQRRANQAQRRGRTLGIEYLEQRNMFSVSFDQTHGLTTTTFNDPSGKYMYIPLTGVDSGSSAINYSVAVSGNTGQVSASILPVTSFLNINVTGTDSGGHAFSGTLTLALFSTLTPTTVAKITSLVNAGTYTNQSFYRIINGFVAQGGIQPTNSNNQFNDEFTSSLTYNSPGLLGMANSGHNANSSEFFITSTTDPLTTSLQGINFENPIFGQLVNGFDVFQKIITTPVGGASGSTPTNPVTITSASIVTNNNQDGVLQVFAPANTTGTSTITVTATGGGGAKAAETLTVNVIADTAVDHPFLGPVSNLTTTEAAPTNFTLTSTDLQNKAVQYAVTDISATTGNVTISVNQTTGVVTLTPKAGFTGTINLQASVSNTGSPSYTNPGEPATDILPFNLTVTATAAATAPTKLKLAAASDDGEFNGDSFTSVVNPTLNIEAQPGETIAIMDGSRQVGTATAVSGSPGLYTATIAAGELAVGANSLTAVATVSGSATTATSTALSLIFAPNYAQSYTVPGTPGTSQTLTFNWTFRQALFNDEIGFTITDPNGVVGGTAPGSAGYAAAAIGSANAQVVFTSGQTAGASKTVTVQGGQVLTLYMIQNNTTANFLANPSAVDAFFSFTAGNSDSFTHVHVVPNPTTGVVQYDWEDSTGGGDQDFNDVVMTITSGSSAAGMVQALEVPGGANKISTSHFTLDSGSVPGEVGLFFVDSANGAIGSLLPGQAGYAAAALQSAQTIFGPGASVGTEVTLSLLAGKFVGFYSLTTGTALQFLNGNAAGASALFSFNAANPSGGNFMRWFAPEKVSEADAGLGDSDSQAQLHIADNLAGGFDTMNIGVDLGV